MYVLKRHNYYFASIDKEIFMLKKWRLITVDIILGVTNPIKQPGKTDSAQPYLQRYTELLAFGH